MDLMELRRGLLLRPRIRTIGGLPVLIDNAFYSSGNGKFDNVVSSDQYFISGFFDTGSTGSKSITFSYTANVMSAYTTYFRLFNDITANSYDYWGNAEKPENLPKTRTLTTGGRFIAFPVYKPMAADMYMYDNTHGVYIFKGKNVT